jgi:hypothetical protein
MTMLTDGIKSQSKEDEIKNLDVVELLAISCGVGETKKRDLEKDDEKPSSEEATAAQA